MIEATTVIITKPHQLILERFDLDDTSLAADAIIAETIVSAISPGTELAAYSGAPPLRPSVQYPRRVGYCNVASVLHVGSDVHDVSVGDRILTFSCHSSHVQVRGSDVLAKVPDSVSSADAALTYLYHLGYAAVLRAELRLGSTAVVVGLGTLGLTAVASAVMAGVTVYAISDHERSRLLAQELGATQAFSRSHVEDLITVLGSELTNAVVSTTNSWADWRLALRLAGKQGTIATLGFPGRGAQSIPSNPLDSQYFYEKQLKILAAGACPEMPDSRGFLPFNERKNIATILSWIASGRIRPSLLVADVLPGAQIQRAYERLSVAGAPGTFLLEWH